MTCLLKKRATPARKVHHTHTGCPSPNSLTRHLFAPFSQSSSLKFFFEILLLLPSQIQLQFLVLIFIDTPLNLTHHFRSSSRTALVASTSFPASPRGLPVPLFTDLPKFPCSKLGRCSLGVTRFWRRSGFTLTQRRDSRPSGGEPEMLNAGWLWSLGRGGTSDLAGGLVLAGLRPGTNAEESPGPTVVEPGSGAWLKMEFDCEGLRRLLGKVRVARRAGPGARGPWGRFHP